MLDHTTFLYIKSNIILTYIDTFIKLANNLLLKDILFDIFLFKQLILFVMLHVYKILD